LTPHTPQLPAFSLTLSIPNDFNPVFDWDPHENSPTTTNMSRKPRLHPGDLPSPPSTPTLSVPTLQARRQAIPTRGRGLGVTKPLPPVPPAFLQSPAKSPTSLSLPTPSSPSSPRSPPRSPKLLSFPLPFLEALKGAGADALKGVSSMGGGYR
jgi:hypothetical protein